MFAKQRLFVLVLGRYILTQPNFCDQYVEKGLEGTAMKCTKCAKWVHKRCFGPQDSVKQAVSFACKRCRHLVHANHNERVTLDGNDLEAVDRFPNLGDVVSSAGGVRKAVMARIQSGWKKFKISGFIT